MDLQNPNDSGSGKAEESPPEKILSSGIQLRASARVSKKLRLDQEQALAQVPSPEKKNDIAVSNGIAPEEKRRRRAPVLWSADDKAAFFEALNEHGKNFDAIEKYMLSRAKKRGDGATKNREKARYFYYRAWHKLSRYVHFPPSVKKVTQELYALINFGELRKKIGHITEKNSQKLNELIYSGRTQVRVRGKTWRIKTPVCRALRRLNNLDDDCEEVRLPARIEVLLSPRTNKDLISARIAGHNPRARAVLSLDTNLSSVISFLKARWSSPQGLELRLGPKSDAVITQPQFKCGQAVTSSSVSLIAHEQRLGGEPAEVQALLDQLHAGKTKGTLKKEKEGTSASEDVANTEFIDPLQPEPSGSLQEPSPIDEKEVIDKEEFSARAREGWTEDTSAKTKIGQLYMMLGCKGILELEYWWVREEDEKDLSKALQRLVSLARLYHFKAKVECPCGHKCKGGAKPGSNDAAKALKRPPATAQRKAQYPVDISPVTVPRNDIVARSLEMSELNQLVSTTFKHPLLPAPVKHQTSTSSIETFKQLQSTFRPKYCNRRGRSRSRGVVVQRMVPLLPKSSQNRPVVVALITPSSTTQSIPPSVGEGVKEERLSLKEESVFPGPSLSSNLNEDAVMVENNGAVLKQEDEAISSIITSTDDPLSTNSFRGLLGGGGADGDLEDDTPPASPSTILKEGEGQWLNSEVQDFSLSSFLGHLESPLKANGAAASDDIHITSDVESHFQSLMTESSLDYTAKFADLAEKIAGGAEPHQT